MILHYTICVETDLPIKNECIIDIENNNYLEDLINPKNCNVELLIFQGIKTDTYFCEIFNKNIIKFKSIKSIVFNQCDIVNNERLLIDYLQKWKNQSEEWIMQSELQNFSRLEFNDCINYNNQKNPHTKCFMMMGVGDFPNIAYLQRLKFLRELPIINTNTDNQNPR